LGMWVGKMPKSCLVEREPWGNPRKKKTRNLRKKHKGIQGETGLMKKCQNGRKRVVLGLQIRKICRKKQEKKVNQHRREEHLCLYNGMLKRKRGEASGLGMREKRGMKFGRKKGTPPNLYCRWGGRGLR